MVLRCWVVAALKHRRCAQAGHDENGRMRPIVHGDLKPGNILVKRDATGLVAVLTVRGYSATPPSVALVDATV